METFITVIHILTAIFMIVVVLIQGGNSGGVASAFGGGNTQGVFGAGGATTFLGKLTYAFAAIFMVTSISLSVIQGSGGKTGLKEKLEKKAAETTAADIAPAAAGAPTETTAPAQPVEAVKPQDTSAPQQQPAGAQ